jgi:hypothetical protein
MPQGDIAPAVRSHGDKFPRPLSRFLKDEDPDVVLRTRPEPTVWSALEYAAHTRDVFTFYDERIARVIAEDRPQLVGVDFDALADERRYNDEDPAVVAAAMTAVATALADRLDALSDDDWARAGIGSEGDERTVLTMARRAAHDGSHHMLDIGRVLRRVRQAT